LESCNVNPLRSGRLLVEELDYGEVSPADARTKYYWEGQPTQVAELPWRSFVIQSRRIVVIYWIVACVYVLIPATGIFQIPAVRAGF